MKRELDVIKKSLHVPKLKELKDVLMKGLTSYFKNVKVEVVDCPNLKREPFTLASPGLCGNARIADVGSLRYLIPMARIRKIYNFIDIIRLCDVKKGLIIGGGGGPWPFIGENCEGIFNLYIGNDYVKSESRISFVSHTDGKCIQERLPPEETRFCLMANVLITEGQRGEVLKVHCHKRTGSEDFISSIRKTLASFYGSEQIVGMGGTFLIKEGKAKHHVMSPFSKIPIFIEWQKNKWLKFYIFSSPLIAVGTFITGDYCLDLRLGHFHSFSKHGEAGHYISDVTPDIIEYIGYFTVANKIYRIDRP